MLTIFCVQFGERCPTVHRDELSAVFCAYAMHNVSGMKVPCSIGGVMFLSSLDMITFLCAAIMQHDSIKNPDGQIDK